MKAIKAVIKYWKKSWIYILGLFSLIWFLVRVIPKPSRAAYPCQRAAFPLASAFIIWISGSLLTYKSYRMARQYLRVNRPGIALGLLGAGAIIFTFSFLIFPTPKTNALGLSRAIEFPELQLDYNVESDQFIPPRATVSIVKTDPKVIADISKEQVEALVREAIMLAGGLDEVISDGNTVVIKPNIVFSTFLGEEISPEANGMVTDWRVVASVAKIVREINPLGTILVMEGTAGASTSEAFEALKYTRDYMPEVDEFLALEKISGKWRDYDAEELKSVLIPAHAALYPDFMLENGSASYYYNRRYCEADVIISMPVLKNHETAGITGAVKNMGIGGTPANIYGNFRGQNGRWNVINHQVDELHKFIHDFYYGCPAQFAVMDGLQGYSNGPNYNFGPTNIEGHQEQMGLILASRDPVALDAIESLVMFDNPRRVPHLVYLDNSNIGCADPMSIRVKGTMVSEVKKEFVHESHLTECTYTDNTSPGVKVQHLGISGDTLFLSFANTEELKMVELSIDGRDLPEFIISGFDHIEIDLAEFTLTDTMVTIIAHDQYMNSDLFKFKGLAGQTVDLELRHKEAGMVAYPNPAGEYLQIRVDHGFTGELQYRFYNGAGQLVKMARAKVENGSMIESVDMSRMKPGRYILVVDTGSEDYSVKIIKQ